MESSVVPPGPAARDQGRQWWWLELVVCTHLAVGISCKCLFSVGGWLQTHVVAGARGGSKGWSQLRLTGSYRGSGCWCIL